MPDPKDRVIEVSEGCFVTAAMMKEVRKEDPTFTDVMDRLDRIERLIEYIFDGHVLIDGRFRKVTP